MKNRMRWLIVMIVLVAACVGIYYYQTQNSNIDTDKVENSVGEVKWLVNKDLEKTYPFTAREVVQLFVRIQKCYYNEEYSEEELVSLAYKAMALFDDELKTNNPFDIYYADLKEEIDLYKSQKKTISRVILDKSSEVVYSTVDEQKCASINCVYYLKGNDGTSKVVETYILRKDSNDKWKILGWKKYEESEWEKNE